MYRIVKITSNHVVDFAAEELKKYLRMMMPRCGEITIAYDPHAAEGYRLGLMSDFGLDTSDAADLALDDIVYIDTDGQGGIIAGSNPRSVLLAVYRFLRENGCRWLFPGIDGEYIPVKAVEAVKYRKLADCRYRGQCNEGCESQQCMIETIDFAPKLGMNVYMIEFDIPMAYYSRYYTHSGNRDRREPEPVTPETVLQWKRVCEAEIAKRGLQFHDMGHGWTVESFGIKTLYGWKQSEGDPVPPEFRQYLAMLNGKRGLHNGVALNTNFCMSNPEARAKVVENVASYAAISRNVDYLHVWLADDMNNHCECDECRKKNVSDWYVVLLNEIDAELEKKNLNTRIVFCGYFDTEWPPVEEKLTHPQRFSLLLAPAGRSYTYSFSDPVKEYEIRPFVLNQNRLPTSLDEHMAYLRGWQKQCGMPSLAYEYHFCLHQWYEPALMRIAKLLNEDVKGYHKNGVQGVIQDSTQRNCFPNGFAFDVYAQTLFDTSLEFEELKEDYFRHAYGEDWKEVADFLEKLSELFQNSLWEGENSADPEVGIFYNPAVVPELRKIPPLADAFRPFVEAHKNMPMRAQTVAYRLLARFLDYAAGLSKAFALKALGANYEANQVYLALLDRFCTIEVEIERYFDLGLCNMLLRRIFVKRDDLPL